MRRSTARWLGPGMALGLGLGLGLATSGAGAAAAKAPGTASAPATAAAAAPATAAPAASLPVPEAEEPPPPPAPTLESLAGDVAALSAELARTRAELEAIRVSSDLALTEALLDAGKNVYLRACASCHGRAGNGKGPAARYLDPAPRDFTVGEYKFRTTPSGSLPTAEDIFRTIREGVPGTSMPAWKHHLTPYELRAVASYIRGFSPRFKSETVDPSEVLAMPAAAPPATPASMEEGEQIYRLLKCWDCHGTKGKGDGPSAPTLKDSKGKKIEAWNFTRGEYKGGASGTAIYRTFNTGMDGTPMPSFADALLFGREAGADLTDISKAYGAGAVTEAAAWLATQPTFEEIGRMDAAALGALTERRRWALVHYVQSLTRKRGLWQYLFRDKPGRIDVPY